MTTKVINIDEDRITGEWKPERDCFVFYIFGEPMENFEKGEVLMQVSRREMFSKKGLKRDMMYIQKRLDEINERAHIVVEKLKNAERLHRGTS